MARVAPVPVEAESGILARGKGTGAGKQIPSGSSGVELAHFTSVACRWREPGHVAAPGCQGS